MTFGSLFAGIGGMDLGLERSGMVPLWQIEIEDYCTQVLEKHWPDVTRYRDVRECGRANLESVDLIAGGFPCQDLSVAGKRAGLSGERSGLWHQFHRILEERRPSWVIVENVPGLLSSNGGADFAVVIQGLAELGYGVAWRILDSQYFGVAQRRRRVFIVGHLGTGRTAQVLFERQSLSGNTAPSRTAGEVVAGTIESRTNGGGFPGTDGAIANHVVTAPFQGRGMNGSPERSDLTVVFEPRYVRNGRGAPSDIVPPLKAQSGLSGKGDAAPVVAFDWRAGDDSKFYTGPNGQHPGGGAKQIVRAGEYSGALNATRQDAVSGAFGVRRLTPTECERLQGFPDGWTAGQSDTARYRQLGNAVTVNVAEWIGLQMIKVLEATP